MSDNPDTGTSEVEQGVEASDGNAHTPASEVPPDPTSTDRLVTMVTTSTDQVEYPSSSTIDETPEATRDVAPKVTIDEAPEVTIDEAPEDEAPEVIEIRQDEKDQESKQQVPEKEASEIRLIEITDNDTLEEEGDEGTVEETGGAVKEAGGAVEEADPIEEKLLLFLEDPARRELAFRRHISPHERYLVHRFVQEHGLKCESTGNNADHKFVVLKEGTAGGAVEEAGGAVKEAGGAVKEAEPGCVGEDKPSGQEMTEDNTAQQPAKKKTIIYRAAHKSVQIQSFDITKVNQKVTLQALKLDKFTGVYSIKINPHPVLKQICDAVKIPFRSELQGGDTRVQVETQGGDTRVETQAGDTTKNEDLHNVSLYMNNIFVAQGGGNKHSRAKKEAGKNALNFLKSRGLRILSPFNLPKKYSMRREMHTFGRTEQEFRRNVRQFIEEFIADPNMLEFITHGNTFLGRKLRGDTAWGDTAWQARIVINIAAQFQLRKRMDGRAVIGYKQNSVTHNLHVEPVPVPREVGQEFEQGKCLKTEGVDEEKEDEEKEDESDDQEAPHEDKEKEEEGKEGMGEEKEKGDVGEVLSQAQKVKPKAKFSEANINRSLTLRFLKLERVCGVYPSTTNILNYLLQITRASKVPCEFKVSGPFQGPPGKRWRVVLHINSVFVAKSAGKTSENAQRQCAKHAFHYLVSKGLRVVSTASVNEEQIKKVTREELNVKNLQQVFTDFLTEKLHLEMRFCTDINEIEKELIEVLIDKNSLSAGYKGTGEMVAWKKYTPLHTMEIASTIAGCTAPAGSKPIALLITSEELAKNSSIREHVENFVKSPHLLELQFSSDIEPLQKELVELLAEKHKLKHDVEISSGEIILSKDPATLCAASEEQPTSSQLNEMSRRQLSTGKRSGMSSSSGNHGNHGNSSSGKSKWGISYTKPERRGKNLGKRSLLSVTVRSEPRITKTIRLGNHGNHGNSQMQHVAHRDDRSRQDSAYRGEYRSAGYSDSYIHHSGNHGNIASQTLLHHRTRSPTKLGGIWGMGQPRPPLMARPPLSPNHGNMARPPLMEDSVTLGGQIGTSSWDGYHGNSGNHGNSAGYVPFQSYNQAPPSSPSSSANTPSNAWSSRDRSLSNVWSSRGRSPPPSANTSNAWRSLIGRSPPPSANTSNAWSSRGRHRGTTHQKTGRFSGEMVLQEDMM